MAAVTSPARHAASLATSAWNREPRRSKVHRAMEWPKPSSARSSVTMSASVPARMQTPSCTSYRLGSITTTRVTRTRLSDIVHPVRSSQLTDDPDRVRSFGGYNNECPTTLSKTPRAPRAPALNPNEERPENCYCCLAAVAHRAGCGWLRRLADAPRSTRLPNARLGGLCQTKRPCADAGYPRSLERLVAT